MNLYEAIFVRKTIKNYTNEALSQQTLDKLRDYFDNLTGLFGNMRCGYKVLDPRKGEAHSTGLFGVRAPYYMAFYSEKASRYLMNMGYIMQQMVLYMCRLGIGTSYLSAQIVKKEDLTMDGMQFVCAVAFGKAKGSHLRKPAEAKRLPLKELCVYKEVPRQWMNQLLEAARMAPSTMNNQPWRFVVYDNRIHIFSKKHKAEHLKKWDEVNFGVMFANLMVAAEEMWLDVDLIRLENISHKNLPNSQYMLSAILKS